MPGSPYWLVDSLRLSVGGIRLRPVADDDLDRLADLHDLDIEMNPATPRPFGLAEREARGVALRQEHWRSLASWTPDSWNLGFTVETADGVVGVQSLEANDFTVLRTVETASWLASAQRGKGIGTLARTAVLALAFDCLGAELALTEAWPDNPASLAVSRRLGYRPNGSVPYVRNGISAAEMLHLRLERAQWKAGSHPDVVVKGLSACRSWFVRSPDEVR